MNYEPTVILYSIYTGVTGVQWAALHMPTWAHVTATVVVGAFAAFVNRQRVTPVP